MTTDANDSPAPTDQPGLIERDEALEAVRSVLAASAMTPAASAGVVVVEGPGGIGISAVLDQAVLEAQASWQVVAVRADELDAELTWSALHRITSGPSGLLGLSTGPDGGESAVPESLLDLGRLVDRATAAVPAPAALLVDLACVVDRVTAQGPLLVVVDDAHLADEASLDLLAALWSRLGDRPKVLLLGAEAVRGTAPAIDRLRRAAVRVVELAPLSREGAAALLARRGLRADDDLLDVIHRIAGGRPDLLDLLWTDQRSPAGGVAPVGTVALDSLIERRLADAPDTRRALDVFCVLARHVDVRTLVDAGGCAETFERQVTELERLGMLVDDGFRWWAPPEVTASVGRLIDPAVADEIRRGALASAIDAATGPEVLVPLAMACPPAGDPVVVDILAEAADVAIRSNRGNDAVELLRRALQEPADADREPELRGRLAMASTLADAPGATTLVRRAARDLDPVAGAHLARRVAMILSGRRRTRETLSLLDDLHARLGPAAPEAASILELGWLTSARLDVSLRPEVRKRLDRISEGGDLLDPSPSGRALAGLVAYELSLRGEDRPRVVELARHGVDHDTGGSPSADLGNFWTAVLALMFADDLDAAAGALDRLERRGVVRGREADLLAAHHLRASVERLRGHVTVARRSASVVATAVKQGWRGSVPGGAGNRCRLALLTGCLAEAEAELELPGGIGRYADDPSLVEYLDARGQLRFRQGRPAEALADHLTVRDRHAALGARNPATMVWAQGAARAMAALGRRAEGLELLDEQLVLARRWGAARPIGMLLTTAGMLRPGRAGDDLLEEAVDVLEDGVTPIELAEAHLAMAVAARHRGDDRRAERAARRAALVAGGAGANAVADAATEILTDVGATGPAGGAVAGLTPAERRVAQLAAQGATNAELAATLFISRKAVEFHLGNVYRKLGISGRRDLAAALEGEPD